MEVARRSGCSFDADSKAVLSDHTPMANPWVVQSQIRDLAEQSVIATVAGRIHEEP